MNKATVILFKPSGKYYTEEEWEIPEGAIGPWDMERSPKFHRISGGAVLVPSQEPWGFPQLFPAVTTGPVSEIYAQRHRNHERWGEKSIENRPSDYAGWLPTLGEEFGEVCRALTLEGNLDRLRAELIDTAAVALMWIDSIDREREAAANDRRRSVQR